MSNTPFHTLSYRHEIPSTVGIARIAVLALLALCLAVPHFAAAQSTGNGTLRMTRTAQERVSLPAPEAAGVVRDVSRTYNYSTGSATISIPLFDISPGDMSLPVTLSCTTGAVRVDDEPTGVGVNWDLDTGGYISRTIAGRPDESCTFDMREDESQRDLQYLKSLHEPHNLPSQFTDAEHDRYQFRAGGISGQFIIRGSKIVQLPKTDAIISRYSDNSFRIVTPDGTTYIYDVTETVSYHYAPILRAVGEQIPDYDDAVCLWRPGKIINADRTDSITFTYSALPDRHRSISNRTPTLSVTSSSNVAGGGSTVASTNDQYTPSHDYRYSNRHSVNSIEYRGGRLTFHTGANSQYDSIRQTDINGNHIKTVRFVYGSYISGIQCEIPRVVPLLTEYSVHSDGKRVDGAAFAYYNQGSRMSRKDFFGYKNSSETSQPLHDGILYWHRESEVLENPTTDNFILAPSQCRIPDFAYMKDNSLKSVTSDSGVTTTFTYEPVVLHGAWRIAANNFDLTVGMRLASESVHDRASDTQYLRTFTYSEAIPTIDMDALSHSNFISVSGLRRYSISNTGLPLGRVLTTGSVLTGTSRQPGQSFEAMGIYYGTVTENITGDNLDEPVVTVYEYDTSKVSTPLTSAGRCYLSESERNNERYITALINMFPNLPNPAFLPAYGSMIEPNLIPGYYREQYGERAPLVKTTEMRSGAGGTLTPRRVTRRHYVESDAESVAMGVYSEPIVRTKKSANDPEPMADWQYASDFNHFTVYADCRRMVCDSIIVTEHGDNGVSRTVTTATEHSGLHLPLDPGIPIGPPIRPVPSSGGVTVIASTGDITAVLPVKSTVRCGSDSIVTEYAYSQGCYVSGIDATIYILRAERAKGRRTLPLTIVQRTGSSKDSCRYDYASFTSGGISCGVHPSRISTYNVVGGTATLVDKLVINSYDRHGNPLSVQRNDWHADVYGWSETYLGLYPTTHSIWGMTTTYGYRPGVGCTSVTSPAGTVTAYGYDAIRLSSQSVAGETTRRYIYSTRRVDGYNAVTTIAVGDTYSTAETRRYDGRGNVVLTVTGEISGNGSGASLGDMAGIYGTLTLRDCIGRPYRAYAAAPYTSATSTVTSLCNAAQAYYSDDSAPYSAMSYAPGSGDARAVSTTIAGEEYASHPATVTYGFNLPRTAANQDSSEAQPWQCRRYSTGIGNDGTLRLYGYYPEGTLAVTRTVDSDGRVSMEFTDYEGKCILRRRYLSATPADTYYVYDDAGNLAYVLPPTVSASLSTVGFTWTASTNDLLRHKAYIYTYNPRLLLKSRKLPGQERIDYWYDATRRLVLTQDGNRRDRGVVAFTVPDHRGREAVTGECLLTNDLVTTLERNRIYAYPTETLSGRVGGYGISHPMQGAVADRVRYYDNYSFLTSGRFPEASSGLSALTAFVAGQSLSGRSNVTGLETGGVVRILRPEDYDGSTATTSTDYMPYVNYYDSRERLSATARLDHTGGFDLSTLTYTNADEPLQSVTKHFPDGGTAVTLAETRTYRRPGRLTSITTQQSGVFSTEALIYDAVGSISRRIFTGGQTFTIDYAYNTNGTLSSLTSQTGFAQTLHYADAAAGCTPSYSGNISAIEWHGVDSRPRRYAYSYDGLGRLTSAAYTQTMNPPLPSGITVSGTPDYSCTYSYDLDSRPIYIYRKGLRDIYGQRNMYMSFGVTDALNLTYENGRLKKVFDSAPLITYTGTEEFHNNVNADVEYTYDSNGNITGDSNRDISSVVYNSLNLPARTSYSNGSESEQLYGADGKLLSRVMTETTGGSSPAIVTAVDYCGPFRYEDGNLARTEFSGGFIADGDRYRYVHDYQGNVRQVVRSSDGAVVQENHYYPYGMLFGESSSPLLARPQAWMGSGSDSHHSYGEYGNGRDKNHYKFGSKEHLTFRGVYQNDFGARMQDPALCMFTIPDPLCEETHNLHSYLYCGADPVNHIDPTGMKIIGTSLEDTNEIIEDIKIIFSADEFADFRDLLKASGRAIAPISSEALASALDGKSLSEDQAVLLNIVVNTINSKDSHYVEYVTMNQSLSSKGTSNFISILNAPYINKEATLSKYGGIPSFMISSQYGGGATKTHKKGSYSVIITDGIHPHGRSVTTGHEIFGHGRSFVFGKGRLDQHIEAIRTENLIMRVMGVGFVNNGENHGSTRGNIILYPEYLPSFR